MAGRLEDPACAGRRRRGRGQARGEHPLSTPRFAGSGSRLGAPNVQPAAVLAVPFPGRSEGEGGMPTRRACRAVIRGRGNNDGAKEQMVIRADSPVKATRSGLPAAPRSAPPGSATRPGYEFVQRDVHRPDRRPRRTPSPPAAGTVPGTGSAAWVRTPLARRWSDRRCHQNERLPAGIGGQACFDVNLCAGMPENIDFARLLRRQLNRRWHGLRFTDTRP